MATVTIEQDLRSKLDRIAGTLNKPVEEIANEAISEHLERLNEQKLEAEIHAFERTHSALKARYLDRFVAIHNGQVVDADADFEPLFLRVQAQFGDLFVLIRQVTESPLEEWRFRSPRLEHA